MTKLPNFLKPGTDTDIVGSETLCNGTEIVETRPPGVSREYTDVSFPKGKTVGFQP